MDGDVELRLVRRVLASARQAGSDGNLPFASLVADDAGTVLAEAVNTTLADGDITAHPELKLARWAARELPGRGVLHPVMITSCEPCAMCRGAIERSGVRRVVFALGSATLRRMQANGTVTLSAVPADVRYQGPVLEDDAARAVARVADPPRPDPQPGGRPRRDGA